MHAAGSVVEHAVGASKLVVIAAVSAYLAYQANMQTIGLPVLGLSGVASGMVGAAFALSTWQPPVQSSIRPLFGNVLWLAALGLVLPCVDHRVHVMGFIAGAVSAVVVSVIPPLHLPILALASSLTMWMLMALCGFGVLRHVFRIV